MFVVIIHYYKFDLYGGMSMDCIINEFGTMEQALNYAYRYAKGLRFAGLQVEDESGKLLYEITSDFNVYDYR